MTWRMLRDSDIVLDIFFDIKAPFSSFLLRFGRRLALMKLETDITSTVRMPTDKEIELFQTSISEQYSMLNAFYAVLDGLHI